MSQSSYRLNKFNRHSLLHAVIDSLESGPLFKGDPMCQMSEADLKDFWWYYAFNLFHRIGKEGTGFSADELIRANETTMDELEKQNFEPQMRKLRMQYFSLTYLLPALAEAISDRLKDEVLEIVKKTYCL